MRGAVLVLQVTPNSSGSGATAAVELVYTGGWDFAAQSWDAQTGVLVQTFNNGHTHVVSAVAVASDGSALFTGSQDQTIVAWCTWSGQQLRTFNGHTNGIRSISVGAAGSWGRVLRTSGTSVRETAQARSDTPNICCFYSGSEDQTVRCWAANRVCTSAFAHHNKSVPAPIHTTAAGTTSTSASASTSTSTSIRTSTRAITSTSTRAGTSRSLPLAGPDLLKTSARSELLAVAVPSNNSAESVPRGTVPSDLPPNNTASAEGGRVCQRDIEAHVLGAHAEWVLETELTRDGRQLYAVSRDSWLVCWDTDRHTGMGHDAPAALDLWTATKTQPDRQPVITCFALSYANLA